MDVNETKLKVMAKIIHEANRAFCETLGDFSQKPWCEAPGYNHESALVAVRAICQNPDISPEAIHDIWMQTKLDDGWVYGPTKDKEKKTHPSIVPFNQLSSSEKYKDYIVLYNVKSYLDYMDQNNDPAEPSFPSEEEGE